MGFALHAGVTLGVVATASRSGVVAYAQRFAGDGVAPGDAVFLDSSFVPSNVLDPGVETLAVIESGMGWAVVSPSQTAWIAPDGTATITSHTPIDFGLWIGAGPTASGFSAFLQQVSTSGTAIVRMDFTSSGDTSKVITTTPTMQPVVFSVAFGPSRGALAQPGQVIALDAQGDASGSWVAYPSPASAWLGLSVTSSAGQAFLQMAPAGANLVIDVNGTITQGPSLASLQATGIIATSTGYALVGQSSHCAAVETCLLRLDATGALVSAQPLAKNANGACSSDTLNVDGSLVLGYCNTSHGVDISSMPTAQSTWTTSWNVPGTIAGVDVHGSEGSALVEIDPEVVGGYEPPFMLPIDPSGTIGAPLATSGLLDARPGGFLAGYRTTTLAFLDTTGATMTTLPLQSYIMAARSTTTGAILAVNNAVGTQVQLVAGTELLSAEAPDDTTLDSASLVAMCPESADGQVLVYGQILKPPTSTIAARRVTEAGAWVDVAAFTIPGVSDLPTDCWACGASCWVLVENGQLLRVTGSVLTPSALEGGQAAGAGNAEHAVVAVLDAAGSQIVVHTLTGKGAADGAPFDLAVDPSVTSSPASYGRSLGVTALDATHFMLAYVDLDARHAEVVKQRVIEWP